MVSGEEPAEICGRDRAMLRALAVGRCELRVGCEPVLVVDGVMRPIGSEVAQLTSAGRMAAGLVSA